MEQYLEIAADKKRGPEWLCVNMVERPGCIVGDLTNLPMPGINDNSFQGIYSQHFIEHLYKYQGINFFKEAMRILKPGGTIRTCWPPHELIEKLVGEEDLSNDPFVQHYYRVYILRHKFSPPENTNKRIQEQVALGLLHQKGEHLYLWGIEEMKNTLRELGFKDVKECDYGVSSVPAFNGIELPDQIRKLHSAQIEATKP